MKRTLLTCMMVAYGLCLSWFPVRVHAETTSALLAETIFERLEEKTASLPSSERIALWRGLVYALDEHIDTHPVVPLLQEELRIAIQSLMYPPQKVFVAQSVAGVTMEQVRQQWLEWNNELRETQGLSPYSMDLQLERTAQERAETLQERNAFIKNYSRPEGGTHRRNSPEEGYYNSAIIKQRFMDRGISAPTTENVGYGAYRCSAASCTSSMINSIAKTYDFFVSEESWGGPHYKSMISSYYTHIGIGIAVDTETNKYWLVVHYAAY